MRLAEKGHVAAGNKILVLGPTGNDYQDNDSAGDGIVSNWNSNDGRIKAGRISDLRADGKNDGCRKHRFQIETENEEKGLNM